ncbi:hypothetical protein GCM10009414_12720 [Tatumella terrea]|uniref:YceI family protein n=1 Tax=Tatumella terrea TaxID=419007 RepID=UPI0031DCCE04
MRRLIFLIPMIIAGCSLPAIGAMYHINPQLSSLVLTWKMIGGGEYHARITGIRGDLSYDPREDDRNTLQSAIPVRQLDAHHWVLTRALRSRTFFDTASYPDAFFSSSRMVAVGEGRYRVLGSLQIKTVRKPLILNAQQNDVSLQRIRLSAQTLISRSAFGMGQYPAIVSDPIRVDIVLYADKIN